MGERLGLRLRFALFFAALAAGGVALIALGLTLGYARSGGPVDGFVIAGLIGGFGLIGLAVWVGFLFDENVARPILALAAELHTRAQSEVSRDIDAAPARYLGALAPAAQAIHGALEETRGALETAVEQKLARMTRDKALLEALLRELADAVVVISADGRILLYNRVATELLGPLGLDRPMAGVLRLGPVMDAVAGLEAGSADHAAFLTASARTGAPLRGTVANIALDRDRIAHVLVFQDPEELCTATGRACAPMDFYDFDLTGTRDPELAARALDDLCFVVFDLETTGLDPQRDEVVQVAGVRVLSGRLLRGEHFDRLVDPGRPIPDSATRIHGISDAMVVGAPAFAEVAEGFRHFTEGSVLVAHHAAFDLAFLKRLKATGGPDTLRPALCTALLSARLFPHTGAHTLDALADRLGIVIPQEIRHTALGDSIATAEVLLKLIPLLKAQGLVTLADVLAYQGQV